jgi:BarA-like signal transduction histidine kinase
MGRQTRTLRNIELYITALLIHAWLKKNKLRQQIIAACIRKRIEHNNRTWQ